MRTCWTHARLPLRLRQGIAARLRTLSTFEKVIAANSVIIVLATIAGWWVTQHNPETYHYLIDTLFIALTALVGIAVNFLLLRAAFAPLHNVLATIQSVEEGDLEARVAPGESNADIEALARAFNAMLDHLAQVRDDAAKWTLRAQEIERRRLALELHDQTGQSLTALSLHAEAIAQGLARDESPGARRARAQAERLCQLAQLTLGEVQGIARQLRPSVLDDLGLEAALRWLAEDASRRFDVSIQAQPSHFCAEPTARLSEEVETALFRIAQESVTNAVRHGNAHHVRMGLRMGLRSGHNHLRLTVADDGRGFDAHGDAGRLQPPTVSNGVGSGLGIAGMRERARLLGGCLRVRSQPGRGCVVQATIPLTSERVPDHVSAAQSGREVGAGDDR
jgi:two-component system sensor histidine kinase UhpB